MYNGVKVDKYTEFRGFMQGLCSVYICLHIHRGNGERHFLPFICSGSGGLVVGCCCWFWFAAAAGGGGSGFPEFERILYFQIAAYSLENRGYFTLFRGFRCWIFATSGSSIHTRLKTVPSTPNPTSHYIPQRFAQR